MYPLKTASLFTMVLWISWLIELGIWGDLSFRQYSYSLCGPNPLLCREKIGGRTPFQLYGTVLGVRIMVRVCLDLSYLFRCRYFLIDFMYRSHRVSFLISFRGNCSMCSCRFGASVGGRTFKNLICHHLGRLLQAFYV